MIGWVLASALVAVRCETPDGRLDHEWKASESIVHNRGYQIYRASCANAEAWLIRRNLPGPVVVVSRTPSHWQVLLIGHSTGTAGYLAGNGEALLREAFSFELNDPQLREKYHRTPSNNRWWSVSNPASSEPGVTEFLLADDSDPSLPRTLIFRAAGDHIVQYPQPLVDEATARAWLRAEAPARITIPRSDH